MDKENVTVKAESTGSLLAMNLILMVLSCVLFVGTTLAWFTDQTSGGVNRIQAGNLDAELWIGESEPLKVKLDSDSDTQPTNTTAVSLKLRKVITAEDNVVTIASDDNDVWNPGVIFISDVMQVKQVTGSVPFKYKLAMSIDPETKDPAEDPASTNGDSVPPEETPEETPPPPKAEDYIDFRIVDVSTISTVIGDTRTYKYDAIEKYFGEDTENAVSPANVSPANEFSSEDEQLSFVIIAKTKSGFTKLPANAESDTIRNPFELIVTLKQLKAEHFEPAAKAGDAT